MPETPIRLLTLQEAMNLFQVSRSTIDRWRRERGMPFVKIGKEVLVDGEQLREWVQEHAQNPHTPGSGKGKEPKGETVIRIGYQSATAHLWSALIIKGMGLLEVELERTMPDRSVRVEWVNAAAGMELVEGMLAGQVQIASLGDYPILVSAALGEILPHFRPGLLAFDGKAHEGRGIALVVPKGVGVHGPIDLCGTTISTVPRSSAERRLRLLLNTLGIEDTRIIHQQMDDGMKSIRERRVGAGSFWEPYPTLMAHYGTGEILAGEDLESDYLAGVVCDLNWARRNEGAVVAYLRAHLRAHRIVRSDPARAARTVARETGYPVQVAGRVVARVRWDAAVYERDLHTLADLGCEDFASDVAGMATASLLQGDYLQTAVQELGLPLLPQPLAGSWLPDPLY